MTEIRVDRRYRAIVGYVTTVIFIASMELYS